MILTYRRKPVSWCYFIFVLSFVVVVGKKIQEFINCLFVIFVACISKYETDVSTFDFYNFISSPELQINLPWLAYTLKSLILAHKWFPFTLFMIQFCYSQRGFKFGFDPSLNVVVYYNVMDSYIHISRCMACFILFSLPKGRPSFKTSKHVYEYTLFSDKNKSLLWITERSPQNGTTNIGNSVQQYYDKSYGTNIAKSVYQQ